MMTIDHEAAARRYEHGTYARYSLAKCRCFACKVANADYVYELAEEKRLPYRVRYSPLVKLWWVERKASGEIVLRVPDRAAAYRRRDTLNAPFRNKSDRERVDTRAVLKHLAELRKTIGLRVIAQRAGIGRSCLQNIASGEFSKIRRATADAILGVVADPTPRSSVDAGPTWKLIREIVATGKSQAWIAKQLGMKGRGLQIRRGECLQSTADRVRALHACVFAPAPAPPTPQRKLADALRHMDADEFATRFSRFGELRGDEARV